jgi:hypothetical protein
VGDPRHDAQVTSPKPSFPPRLSKAAKASFADAVLERLASAPFGTVPKRELDVAIFTGLVRAGAVDPYAPLFHTARQLGITPGRVRSLLYAYRLAEAGEAQEASVLLDRVRVVSLDPRGDAVLNIEDAFDRDVFVAILKEHGVFTDSSFNRERVVMPAGALLDVLETVFADVPGELGAEAAALREAARGGELRQAVLDGAGRVAGEVLNLTMRAIATQAGVFG